MDWRRDGFVKNIVTYRSSPRSDLSAQKDLVFRNYYIEGRIVVVGGWCNDDDRSLAIPASTYVNVCVFVCV